MALFPWHHWQTCLRLSPKPGAKASWVGGDHHLAGYCRGWGFSWADPFSPHREGVVLHGVMYEEAQEGDSFYLGPPSWRAEGLEFALRTGHRQPHALPTRLCLCSAWTAHPVARVTSSGPSRHPSWSVILAPDIIILCDILISSQATGSALSQPAGYLCSPVSQQGLAWPTCPASASAHACLPQPWRQQLGSGR